MADTQINSDAADLLAALKTHTEAVAGAHVQVSFGLIFVVLMVLASSLGIMYFENQQWRKELDKADAINTQYHMDLKDAEARLAQSMVQRQQDTAAQQVIVKVVHDRDTSANNSIAAVTSPDKTAQQVAQDAGKNLGETPSVTPDNRLAFTAPKVQDFEATLFDRDRFQADFFDVQNQLHLEEDKTAKLNADVGNLQQMLNECGDDVAAYKKVAKKTRWHRVLAGLKWGGTVALTAVVGYGVGRALHP